MVCNRSLMVFFSSLSLSSSSSSSLPYSNSLSADWADEPVIHRTNQFLIATDQFHQYFELTLNKLYLIFSFAFFSIISNKQTNKKHTQSQRVNTYFNMIIIKIAGIVDISNQMQPQVHNINAIDERNGDSHSRQLLRCYNQMIVLFSTKTKKVN